MAWNPGTYNKFKEERYAPFYDLLALLHKRENLKVIDLGCGTAYAKILFEQQAKEMTIYEKIYPIF